jgi:hypothetical protein
MPGRALRLGRNGIRIGIALCQREITAVVLGRKHSPSSRAPVCLEEEGTERRDELARGFLEVRKALEKSIGQSTEGARVFVTLLPPLADARILSLPPMRKAEVQAVVARDVARYFLGARRSQVVGTRLPRGKGWRGPAGSDPSFPVLAAAASLSLLEDVRQASGGMGWAVQSFSAAHSAWMNLPSSIPDQPVRGLVAVVESTAHVVRLDGRNPTAVRKIPSSDGSAIAGALLEGEGKGKVRVLASPQAFEVLQGQLASHGLTAVRDANGWTGPRDAAASRADATELELLPATISVHRKERDQRRAVSLLGAAAVLILASLATHFVAVQRELATVRDRRADIRTEVAPLLTARDSLDLLTLQVESMEEISRKTPVWTRALVELAALLPQEIYLTGFYASGDTVELEAAGAGAGEAIQLLRGAGLFEELRLEGVVERELEDGETAVERFRLRARVPPVTVNGG